MLAEEEVTFENGNGRVKKVVVGFFPIGTKQLYDVRDGVCDDNDTLRVTSDQKWSFCEAPQNLAVIDDEADLSELLGDYLLINYGIWSDQPPACGK